MTKLRFISLLLFSLLFISVQAQERFFEYMSGWFNNYSTELEEGYLLFGLDTGDDGPLDHYYRIDQIDFGGELIDEYEYEVDSVDVTSAFWTSQRAVRIGEMIYTAGLFGNPSEDNTFYGGLFRHDIAEGETELVESYDDDEFVKIDCITQKNDTSLLLAGYTSNNLNQSSILFKETDLDGEVRWSFEQPCNGNCRWFAHTILPLSNGHSALLVNAFNANFPTFEDREKSILIVVDENGEELWRVEPGNPDDYKTLPGGLLEIDGNILLCYTDPYFYDDSEEWQINFECTIHLVSLSLEGDILSETDLSSLIPDGNDPDEPDIAHNITQLTQLDESSILLSGHTSNEGLLINYDLEGELNWMRLHHPHPLDFPNASQNTEIYHVLQTSDGGFLCTGQYFTFPFELEPDGQQTAFALKVDQYGCLEEGCQGSLSTEEVTASAGTLRVFPNPASDYTSVEYRIDRAFREAKLEAVDLLGRVVHTQELKREQDTITLPLRTMEGVYLIALTVDGELYRSSKLLVK